MHNHGAAALDAVDEEGTTVKDLLDREMDKCNLLCANCHHRHTCKYKSGEAGPSGA